ncbi:MAG TPA: hypothetical protein VHB30_13860 [Solirubrobacteraceae bacterium]|nr:hypothetical protein [Solirubrobacteraceae bacterium]
MPRRPLLVLVPLASLALAVPAHADYLGPAPAVCATPDPSCLVRGGGGDVTVSPRIVQVGKEFTVTLTDTGDYGGPASWGMPSISALGAGSTAGYKLVKPGCVGRKVSKKGDQWTASAGLAGSFVCHYKATSAGRGWQKATIGFNVRYGGLASYSEDTFHVVGKESGYIEGYVRGLPRNKGAVGPGIRGMRVKAAGSDGGTATTNGDGYYAIEVGKSGSYDVTGELRASDRKVKPLPKLSPAEREVKVKTGSKAKDVDFKLSRGDDFDVTFLDGKREVTSTPADGVKAVTAAIRAKDPNDDPIVNKQLQLVVNGARLAPRAVVCAGNERIWPSGIVRGARGADVDSKHPLQTDGKGHADLTVYVGTEPGSFELTVRNQGAQASNSPEGSATLRLTREDGATLSSTIKSAIVAGVPGAKTPLAGSVAPGASAQHDIVTWLTQAKASGQLRGWDFVPVVQDGTVGPASYGVAFWRSGSPPNVAHSTSKDVLVTGSVFTTGVGGLNPLRDGAPLTSLSAWGAGLPVIVDRLSNGYAGSDLSYLGWPYELGPESGCVNNGP